MTATDKIASVGSGLTGLSALGLFSTSMYVHPCFGFDEPLYLLAKFDPMGTMLCSLIGGLFLAITAPMSPYESGSHTKDIKMQLLVMLGAALIMVAASLSLADGFGPEMDSKNWNQPSGWKEKSIFGSVWGGMLTAGTLLFAWNARDIVKNEQSSARSCLD
jgi:hypothetical protein